MRLHYRLAGGAAVSAALAATALLTATIPAASAAARVRGSVPAVHGQTEGPQLTRYHALGFAGYKITKVPKQSSGQTTFVVPTLKCPSSAEQATDPGVLILGKPGGFEQSYLLLWCHQGTPIYQARVGYYEIGNDTPLPVTVKPGDTVTMGVKETSASKTGCTVTFSDPNQNYSFTGTGPGTVGAWEVDIGSGDYAILSGVTAPPPDFGQIPYSGSSIDGQTLAAAKAAAYDRKSNGKVLIATSPLNATGDGFVQTFKHA